MEYPGADGGKGEPVNCPMNCYSMTDILKNQRIKVYDIYLKERRNSMAACRYCGCEMLTAEGCGISKVRIGGRVYPRIRFGGRGDLTEGTGKSSRCFDCNALTGHFHHVGCDAERCPKCGGQLISCSCGNAGFIRE